MPPRAPKPAFTGRAAVLAVVVLGLLLTIAYPLQDYLAQRGDISTLRAQNASAKARVAALEREAARWQDPAFVRQQAKQRLYFVAPGDKTYVVLGLPAEVTAAAAGADAPKAGAVKGTWYERMWASVVATGHAAEPVP